MPPEASDRPSGEIAMLSTVNVWPRKRVRSRYSIMSQRMISSDEIDVVNSDANGTRLAVMPPDASVCAL